MYKRPINLPSLIVVLVATPLIGGCPGGVPPSDALQNEAPRITAVSMPRVTIDSIDSATITHIQTMTGGNAATDNTMQMRRYRFGEGLFTDEIRFPAEPETAQAAANLLVSDAVDARPLALYRDHNFDAAADCRFTFAQVWSCTRQDGWRPVAMKMARGPENEQALALLQESGTGSLEAALFDLFTGWGIPQRIAGDISSDTPPQRDSLVYHREGVGFAVWADRQQNVQVSRFDRTSGTWGAPVTLGQVAEDARPHIALHPEATDVAPLVVWQSPAQRIQYSVFNPTSGWPVAQSVPVPGLNLTDIDGDLQIAMGEDNVAMLLVKNFALGSQTVVVLRFNHRSSRGAWEAPQVVGQDPDIFRESTRIAMPDGDYAIALWLDRFSNVMFNRFRGSSWGSSQAIGTVVNTVSLDLFDLDVPRHDRAMAVWAQQAPPSLGGSRLAWHVFGAPIPRVTFTPAAPNINQSVVFDASSTTHGDFDIAAYEWDFNYDRVTFDVNATGVTTAVAFPSAGDKLIALRVRDTTGLAAIVEVTIPVAAGGPSTPR